MSDEIEFGEIQHQEPDRSLRPDRNPQFCVAPVGDLNPGDLPIYVELDVMRDMEGHAQTNTNVELGGGMLGYQYHDEDGQPFVVVTDCLRAEHYEATKGSFKFTHETWQTIARQRDEYPEEIQMVGWYHTHPDWGVFLSGMDLFICNNFFNRPLDVALVIDPCRDDRGWFYWDAPQQTERTGGFFLYASRFRESEIGYFANLYQGNSMMASDPRYNPMSAPGGQSIVNIHDQRTPIQNIAIMGMMTIQMLILALLAYKMISPDDKNNKTIADIEKSLDTIAQTKRQEARNEATQKVLNQIVAAEGGGKNTASKMIELEQQLAKRRINEEAEYVHREALKSQNRSIESKLGNLKKKHRKAEKDLIAVRGKLTELENSGVKSTPQWVLICGALLFAVFGAVGGYIFKQYLGSEDEYEDERSYRSSDRPIFPESEAKDAASDEHPPEDDGISLIESSDEAQPDDSESNPDESG